MKTHKGSGYLHLRELAYDPDGFLYTAGYFQDTIAVEGDTLVSRGYSDIFILKYDTQGNIVWKKQLGSGLADERVFDLMCDQEGNIYLTGGFDGHSSFDGIKLSTIPWDAGNAFVAKLTSEGEVQWAKDIGGDRVNLFESGYSLYVDHQRNVYITGLYQKNLFVCKLDTDGRYIWKKYAGGDDPLVNGDSGHDIVADSAGNSYVVGHFLGKGYFGKHYMNSEEGGEGFLAKYNASGNVEWVTNFDGSSSTLRLDKNGDLIISGYIGKGSQLGNGEVDETGGMVAKISPSGKLYWAQVVPNYRGYDVSIDKMNNILVSGELFDTVKFNNQVYPPRGNDNHLVTSFSTHGNERWAFTIVDSLSPRGYANQILLDENDNLYIADIISDEGQLGCQKIKVQSETDPYLIKIKAIERFQLQGVSNVCLKGGGLFSLNTPPNTLKYAWKIPDSLENKITYINDSTLQVVFPQAGEFVLSVEGVLEEGCEKLKVSDYYQIKVHPPLEASQTISGRNSVCPGQQGEHYRVEASPYAEKYEWILPEGIILVENNENEIVVDYEGDFLSGEIRLQIKNYCHEAEFQQLGVSSDMSVADAQEISGPKQLCTEDQRVTYTVPEIEKAEEYRWNLPYGLIPGDNSHVTKNNSIDINVLEFSYGGSITVQGVNLCGEGKPSASFEVVVNQSPKKMGKISGPLNVCSGTSAVFEVSEVYGVDAYVWEFSEGMVSPAIQKYTTNLNRISLDILKDGYVTVYGKNECGAGEASSAFQVTTTGLSDFESPVILKDCNILYHEQPHIALQWYKDGAAIDTDSHQLLIQEPGLYSLKYVTQCGVLEDQIIIKWEDIEWFIPNVFTPNGDEQNDTFQLSENLYGSRLEVYNRWGKKVYVSDAYTNNWDGGRLPSGIYRYIVYPICFENPITGMVSILRQLN
uniref:Gliding motility-associated C-terminal domain-containing protein n=1 Tax=Roseihalotalea indica TaxID=2867963 RepID=A0AA49JJL8_9BACT|nr:gliding motility-associated C-terminal domain-containing protein [Tunicatimonas sp. TK19036]